jgi:hypothetical protein
MLENNQSTSVDGFADETKVSDLSGNGATT